ncbi:MAG: LOG family protein [Deltaproteobacteria bacterium]|nr:LOG family protein [Deltaproteobacteria bacterium]
MNEGKPAPPNHYPLAYKNERFLDSDDARALRILAEYLEPLYRFHEQKVPGTVVFFGSARLTPEGPLGHYYTEARELARLFTQWSNALPPSAPRFLVCSGGGNGIMEAANGGAAEAGGRTVGLNISLPEEQSANPHITPELCFEFHYFFMRKLWFAHLARAVIIFPGGFGTLDELSEILTLSQTRKLEGKMTVILYGKEYWSEIINFPALVKHGMIDPADLELFSYADTPADALALLQAGIAPWLQAAAPAYAKTRPSRRGLSYFYQRSGD